MKPIENPSFKKALPALICGAVTLIIAWPVAHLLGFATLIDALMFWTGGGSLIVLIFWYGMVYMAVSATARGTAMLIGLQALAGNGLIDRLGAWFARRVRGINNAVALVLHLLIGLPLRLLWEKGWKPIEGRIVDLANRMEIERELRREYRENYRHIYASFAEFKRAYYGESESKEEKEQPQTPIAEAYALLGLSEDCTRAQLDAQYRNLMKKVHPDAGGTQALAARINQAKDLIMKEKGWK